MITQRPTVLIDIYRHTVFILWQLFPQSPIGQIGKGQFSFQHNHGRNIQSQKNKKTQNTYFFFFLVFFQQAEQSVQQIHTKKYETPAHAHNIAVSAERRDFNNHRQITDRHTQHHIFLQTDFFQDTFETAFASKQKNSDCKEK